MAGIEKQGSPFAGQTRSFTVIRGGAGWEACHKCGSTLYPQRRESEKVRTIDGARLTVEKYRCVARPSQSPGVPGNRESGGGSRHRENPPASRWRVRTRPGRVGAHSGTARLAPGVTDEGHYILDAHIPPDSDPGALATALKTVPGVGEHGLFLDMAELALLGREDGSVERVER